MSAAVTPTPSKVSLYLRLFDFLVRHELDQFNWTTLAVSNYLDDIFAAVTIYKHNLTVDESTALDMVFGNLTITKGYEPSKRNLKGETFTADGLRVKLTIANAFDREPTTSDDSGHTFTLAETVEAGFTPSGFCTRGNSGSE